MTSVSTPASFTGFEDADIFITQPLLIVAGSEDGSLWYSRELIGKASKDKELIVISGATRVDLYDGAGATTAATKLAPYFKSKLATA